MKIIELWMVLKRFWPKPVAASSNRISFPVNCFRPFSMTGDLLRQISITTAIRTLRRIIHRRQIPTGFPASTNWTCFVSVSKIPPLSAASTLTRWDRFCCTPQEHQYHAWLQGNELWKVPGPTEKCEFLAGYRIGISSLSTQLSKMGFLRWKARKRRHVHSHTHKYTQSTSSERSTFINLFSLLLSLGS